MACVRDRAQAEQDELVRGREADRLEYLGHERDREPCLHRALDRARADSHDDHEPQQAKEHLEVRGEVGLVLLDSEEAAAEAGDAGREGEGDDPSACRVDADRRRGRLAAAQRVEVSPGRSFPS
jgi:hypothetical protein